MTTNQNVYFRTNTWTYFSENFLSLLFYVCFICILLIYLCRLFTQKNILYCVYIFRGAEMYGGKSHQQIT